MLITPVANNTLIIRLDLATAPLENCIENQNEIRTFIKDAETIMLDAAREVMDIVDFKDYFLSSSMQVCS